MLFFKSKFTCIVLAIRISHPILIELNRINFKRVSTKVCQALFYNPSKKTNLFQFLSYMQHNNTLWPLINEGKKAFR